MVKSRREDLNLSSLQSYGKAAHEQRQKRVCADAEFLDRDKFRRLVDKFAGNS